jgi:hypothetical protein
MLYAALGLYVNSTHYSCLLIFTIRQTILAEEI